MPDRRPAAPTTTRPWWTGTPIEVADDGTVTCPRCGDQVPRVQYGHHALTHTTTEGAAA